jgi:hypothetical protein
MTFKGKQLYNYLWGWHLGYLNALLPTLVGLFIAAFIKAEAFKYTIKGVIILRTDGWLSNFLSRRSTWAFTLGHIIFVNSNMPNRSLRSVLPHELVHVHQYEIFGVFFWLIYGISYLAELLRGHNAMRTCVLEAAAYHKQDIYKTTYIDSTGAEHERSV